MTNKYVLLLSMSALTCHGAIGQHGLSSEPITSAKRIARLGTPGNDDVADIKVLTQSPKASTGLLIAALHPIPDSEVFAKAGSPRMENTLELIRALRYMTGGMDFCSQSKHTFISSEEEKNRKYWLSFTHKSCLSFFGVWPSRDRTYIAPIDAQKRIISRWQNWYAADGSKFVYRPLQNPPPEKWMW